MTATADFPVLLQSSAVLWFLIGAHFDLVVDTFIFMSGLLLVLTAKDQHPLRAIAGRYLR